MTEEMVQADQYLSERERFAYLEFLAKSRTGGSSTFPIAPDRAAGMFELFLQGRGLEEIRQVMPQFGLGQIAHAAVEGQWHERRAAHLDQLLRETQSRVAQTALEGAKFVSDALAATHRLESKKLEQILANGTGESGFVAQNPGQYKQLVENLRNVTGQDVKTPRGRVDETPQSTTSPLASVVVEDPAKKLAAMAAERKKAKK